MSLRDEGAYKLVSEAKTAEDIQKLEANGIDLNARNMYGETALINATKASGVDSFNLLIESGSISTRKTITGARR